MLWAAALGQATPNVKFTITAAAVAVFISANKNPGAVAAVYDQSPVDGLDCFA
jgi:hypothetical protein